MAYKSIYKPSGTTTARRGYVSMFADEEKEKDEKGNELVNDMLKSGQATTEPIGTLPAREKQPDVSAGDVAREAWNIVSSPFKKAGQAIKKEYQEKASKTPEQKTKEQAVRSLAGYDGKLAQDMEVKKMKEGISMATEEDLANLTKEKEIQTEKAAKVLIAPIRYTAGELAKAVTSYSLEKANSNAYFDARSDTEKLLVGEERIQRLTKQEDLYGMIARGAGIPAALTVMVLIENPFLKETGISSIIKNRLKKMATKEAEGLVVKMGAKEFARIADDAIKAELKAGKITEEQAVKATEELAKMKKPALPKKTEFGDFMKKKRTEDLKAVEETKKIELAEKRKTNTVKYIPEEKLPDLRKKITTEKLTTTPKVSKRISNETIEKGLVDNFGDIPDRDIIKFKDQAKLVGDIIDSNPEKAIKIALGKELPKNGALPESVFIAVKNQALKNGDTGLLRQLATEPGGVASEASVLGARIKMLDEGMKDDAFKTINKLVKSRNTRFEKGGKKVSTAIKEEVKKIKIAKPDRYDWDAFVNSIKC